MKIFNFYIMSILWRAQVIDLNFNAPQVQVLCYVSTLLQTVRDKKLARKIKINFLVKNHLEF